MRLKELRKEIERIVNYLEETGCPEDFGDREKLQGIKQTVEAVDTIMEEYGLEEWQKIKELLLSK